MSEGSVWKQVLALVAAGRSNAEIRAGLGERAPTRTLAGYLSAARAQTGKRTPRPSPEWPDARVAAVARLWAEGCTAAQIAAEIGGGLTRSAVIGKVHRLGLPARERGARPKPGAGKIIAPTPVRVAKRPAPRAAPATEAKPAPVPTPPVAAPAIVPAAPVDGGETALVASIFDLVEGQCKWPLAAGFCGRPSVGGKSYCAHHALRSVDLRRPLRPPRVWSEGRKSERRERIADCVEMFGPTR
jgi:GcrA cell cycle regulator